MINPQLQGVPSGSSSGGGAPRASGVSYADLLQVLGEELEEQHLPLLLQLSGVVTDPASSAALEQLLRASSSNCGARLP
jgi:hypothetical protein